MRSILFFALLSACVAPTGDRDHDFTAADAGMGSGSSVPTGCDELKIVTTNMTLTGTSSFSTVPTTCWKLSGKLTINGPAVTSLAKLGDLRGVTDLEINDSELTKLDTVNPLVVSDNIYIHHNDKLTDVSNLAPKSTVQTVRIEHNPKLPALSLSAQRIEAGLTVSDNAALTSITLTSLQSTGAITIARNPLLTTIIAGSALTQVHSTFTLDDNDALRSLGQFGTNVSFSSGIQVTGNAQLSSLGQLSHAKNVLGIISINNNAALDLTYAHEVACCVQSGGFTAQNNMYQDCEGGHWCQNQHNCYR